MTTSGGDNLDHDEMDILNDQDETVKKIMNADDENMGAKSRSLDSLENEPEDFINGKRDVYSQMDKSAHEIMEEDHHEEELQATFENTPGGLDEVAMKTDRELAKRHHARLWP